MEQKKIIGAENSRVYIFKMLISAAYIFICGCLYIFPNTSIGYNSPCYFKI